MEAAFCLPQGCGKSEALHIENVRRVLSVQTALGECHQGPESIHRDTPAGELKSVGVPRGPVDFRAMLTYVHTYSHSMC